MSEAFVMRSGTGLKITKLWENASPGSSFSGQTINFKVSAKENDIVLIISDGEPAIAYLKQNGFTTGMFFTGFSDMTYRTVLAYPNKIVFGNCNAGSYNSSGEDAVTRNTSCVPIAIYLLEAL